MCPCAETEPKSIAVSCSVAPQAAASTSTSVNEPVPAEVYLNQLSQDRSTGGYSQDDISRLPGSFFGSCVAPQQQPTGAGQPDSSRSPRSGTFPRTTIQLRSGRVVNRYLSRSSFTAARKIGKAKPRKTSVANLPNGEYLGGPLRQMI